MSKLKQFVEENKALQRRICDEFDVNEAICRLFQNTADDQVALLDKILANPQMEDLRKYAENLTWQKGKLQQIIDGNLCLVFKPKTEQEANYSRLIKLCKSTLPVASAIPIGEAALWELILPAYEDAMSAAAAPAPVVTGEAGRRRAPTSPISGEPPAQQRRISTGDTPGTTFRHHLFKAPAAPASAPAPAAPASAPAASGETSRDDHVLAYVDNFLNSGPVK